MVFKNNFKDRKGKMILCKMYIERLLEGDQSFQYESNNQRTLPYISKI